MVSPQRQACNGFVLSIIKKVGVMCGKNHNDLLQRAFETMPKHSGTLVAKETMSLHLIHDCTRAMSPASTGVEGTMGWLHAPIMPCVSNTPAIRMT